jgi:hypothetical protein
MPKNVSPAQLSLNGEWQIQIGEHQGTVNVPGVWETQGYPRDINQAVYTRQFSIPDDWHGQHVMLRFGAVSYHVTVLVNGHEIGAHAGLWTSFTFDVSDALLYGKENNIELRIIKPSNILDDDYDYRHVLVGFIPYVSTTFGGPWQDIELITHPGPAWDNLQVLPDWHTGKVNIQANTQFETGNTLTEILIFNATGQQIAETSLRITPGTPLDITIPITDPQSWSPESPYRYQAMLRMLHDDEIIAQETRKFGFRALHTHEEQLYLNDKPYLLRGILHWGWDPDTLAPMPTDEFVRAEFQRIRELGFNLVKLCLFVPTDNVFRIADEEGMLLWLELPMWWQLMNPHLREQAPLEYADIMAQVQHHPSIVMVSTGCELEAHMADTTLLSELDNIIRTRTSNCLVCDNSGSGEAYAGINIDLADFYDYHFYCDLHQFVPLLDHFRRDWRTSRPWIFGEYCAYDDIRNPEKLDDENGQPWWRKLLGTDGGIHRWAYRDQEKLIDALDLPFTTEDLLNIARKQSWTIRKNILEKTRTRRHIGGYVITGLRDTPISTSGLFDDFNRPKYDPEAFCTVNNDNVLLLEQGRRRVWKNGDQPAPLDIYNYVGGEQANLYIVASHLAEVSQCQLNWQLVDPDGNCHAKGSVPVDTLVGNGNPHIAAQIEWIFPTVKSGQIWILQATLGDYATNSWSLYVHPEANNWKNNLTIYDPADVLNLDDILPQHSFDAPNEDHILLTTAWTADVQHYVSTGGKAILMQSGSSGLPAIATGFWQEAAHLLYPHPIWDNFPYDGYVAENFYHLATEYAFDTNALSEILLPQTTINPVMRRLHTRLFTASDYVLDIELGKGRLLATTLRLHGGLGDQVRGLQSNIAGQSLLDACVSALKR